MTTMTAPTPAIADETVVRTRSWSAPIVLGLLGLLALGVFGFGSESGEESTFAISFSSDFFQIDPVSVPSRAAGIVLGLVCLAVAAYAFIRVRAYQKVPLWAILTFIVAFVLAFLVWSVAGGQIHLTGLMAGAVLLSVPLAYGAMSGVLCERAGVINIAIEGQLLFGAFLAAAVASLTDSLYAGLFAAVVAGILVAWVLAVFAIKYVVNQIIVGVVLNVLVLGLTNFLYSQLLAPEGDTWNSPGTFSRIKIPVLGDIPIIGPMLFNHTVIVYLMYVTVIVLHIGLFHTRWGLRVRSVGEHPQAADTMGIAVNSVRFRNVLLGGVVSGLGGAFLTIGNAGVFSREISAGQGFIALAAMIFGRWTPFGALGAALLFGFVSNLRIALRGVTGGAPLPDEFLLMAPYIVTILAVAGLVGRVRAPAADGQPYIKG